MWYSKYSNYTPEQIMISDYEKICVQFLSMVKDEKIKEKMKRYTL